ncbi:metalloendopeptidase-like membrane protein [Paramagnetospirillum caucaseum]|uniref:Metalloendopeptidase-like membrane protein n=2 Tax=Paramagnetospirillum caucaseum TaxID=1244869 RepID=M2Y756_9PROT|nr:metalloendopeptidase-like membrane protein [Paramagnetospirillum caucaseum]
MIPEWQVFIRRPNGTAEHFTFTRKRQLVLLGIMAVVTVWAGIVSALLTRQPDEIAAKERQLDEMMAATRAAQYRLASSQKMVADIAREVDLVHSNIVVLAETNAALAKDQPPRKVAAAPAKRSKSGAEPAWNEDGQPAGDEARAVREQVRRLEGSLERLRVAYSQAVQNTDAAAQSRISDTERLLARLGLDASRLFERRERDAGRGGPFIPLNTMTGDSSLSNLIDRLDRWSGIKAVMQKMPLGEPLRAEYDLNSSFGTRNDPLNRRTGMHEGLDLGAPHGTPIYATGDGVVEFAGPWDRYGLTVEINHGNGVATRYAHMSRIKVKEGQKVSRSTVIGLLGNTGRSTGPHLHYEVRVADVAKDPLKFIAAGEHAPKAW